MSARADSHSTARSLCSLTGVLQALCALRFNQAEIEYMRTTGYFSDEYLEWLHRFRFCREQVYVYEDKAGHLGIHVKGPWEETILWEGLLLALVSEITHEFYDGVQRLLNFRKTIDAK